MFDASLVEKFLRDNTIGITNDKKNKAFPCAYALNLLVFPLTLKGGVFSGCTKTHPKPINPPRLIHAA